MCLNWLSMWGSKINCDQACENRAYSHMKLIWLIFKLQLIVILKALKLQLCYVMLLEF